MKVLFSFLLLISSLLVFSQNQLTLEEIWNGKFNPEYLEEIHHLNNGKEFSVLETTENGAQIIAKNYLDNSKKRVVYSDTTIKNYEFSTDETKLLIASKLQRRYRYSRIGLYYVYDITKKEKIPVSENPIITPQFSPDGTKVAYVFQNNLYYFDLNTKKTTQITTDGAHNKIINGLSDWVYEEEFAIVTAFSWNNDSSKLAFLKFDESQVPEYSMDIYASENYPIKEKFKYPKAGENNSVVTTHIYDIATAEIDTIDLSDFESYYIPRLQWTPNSNQLVLQTLNRHQNDFSILKYNTVSKKTTSIYNEKNQTYIDVTDYLTFLKDDSFLLTSEKSGYNHLYHFSESGKLKKQITNGNWEVTDFYGMDPEEKTLYYQSTEENNIERQLYKVSLTGKKKTKLSSKKGTHSADFNSDFSNYIDTFSNSETPYTFSLHNAKDGKQLKVLLENDQLSEQLQPYSLPKKEFSKITISGEELNSWMIKPVNFDATKKYPVLLFQYSGPGSQMVKNSWNRSNDYWYYLLTKKGYIVACVDGKGTGFKGEVFKKSTQKKLGKFEAEDQIAFAKYLASQPYIDASRIGIWGWSFGGFTTLNAILKDNSVFKAAISVAPVTHWKYYDTIYTERFLTTPQENPEGYDENSPLTHAANLNCKLLLVHGTADDNVHVQNTLQMASEFTKANKAFDLAIYTNKNHRIEGGYTRLHLYTKMTEFILENL